MEPPVVPFVQSLLVGIFDSPAAMDYLVCGDNKACAVAAMKAVDIDRM